MTTAPVPLSDQIAALRVAVDARTSLLNQRVHRKQTEAGDALAKITAMDAGVETLKWLQRNEAAIKAKVQS